MTQRGHWACIAAVEDDYLNGYSIASSAVATGVCGTVRPSVLAVFRLMARSNFVGCRIGMSAGGTFSNAVHIRSSAAASWLTAPSLSALVAPP